jgi:hypothetical protein
MRMAKDRGLRIGFRLWHDLQQRVGPNRELPYERPVMR